MYKGKSFLAIMPIRGGSKGLLNKNIMDLHGKPLFYWAAKAAKDSGIFDRIVIYSDSIKYIEVAQSFGFETMLEPKELAADDAYVSDAMVDCLRRVSQSHVYDYVQLIQSTSPLLMPYHIQNAAEWCIKRDADFVIGVSLLKDSTTVVKHVPNDYSMKGWYPEEYKGKTRQQVWQERGGLYKLNGYIYLGKWDIWIEQQDWWSTNIYGFPIVDEDVDIDTLEDFKRAEQIMKEQNENIVHDSWFSRFRKKYVG